MQEQIGYHKNMVIGQGSMVECTCWREVKGLETGSEWEAPTQAKEKDRTTKKDERESDSFLIEAALIEC